MRPSRIVNFLRALTRNTAGQDLIEYGLLLGMASAVTVYTLSAISNKVADVYIETVTQISSGGGAGDPGGGAGDPGGGAGDPGGGTGDPGGGPGTGGDTGGTGRGGGRGN